MGFCTILYIRISQHQNQSGDSLLSVPPPNMGFTIFLLTVNAAPTAAAFVAVASKPPLDCGFTAAKRAANMAINT